MGREQGETRAGVSAYDVEGLLRQVQRDYHGICGFDIGVPVRQMRNHALTVRVWFRRAGSGDGGSIYERGVSGAWPTGQCRTFTGLMFRLLHELDIKLGEEKAEAERATQGRFGGF